MASTGRNQNDPTPENRRINSTSVQLMMSYNLYRGGADSARVRQTSAQSYAARDIRDYTCRNVQQDWPWPEQHHQPEPAHAVPA